MAEALTYQPDRLQEVLSRQFTEGIGIISPTGAVKYVSDSVKKILGYNPDEAQTLNIFNVTHADDLPQLTAVMHELVANPGVMLKGYCIRIRHKDRSWRWLQTNAINMIKDPSISGILGNFRDVTQQKENELKLKTANRLYNLHSRVNQAIVHTKDLPTLFQLVCKIGVETGGFKFARIREIDELGQTTKMIAEYGAGKYDGGLLTSLKYEPGGPVSQLLSGADVWIVNDFSREPINSPWSRFAFPRGYQSAIAVPLKKNGKTVYILSFYVSRPGFFTAEEAQVLRAAADDISFAIDSYEKEVQRRKVEEQLRQSEVRLNQAQAIAHLGSWEFNTTIEKAIWSQELCNIYGVPATENTHGYESWLSFIHPDDRVRVMQLMEKEAPRMRSFSFEYRIVRRDGNTRHLLSHNYFELTDTHLPLRLYGATLDITTTKETEEKLVNVNRLYSFVSQINQTIVHKCEEHTVFKEICRIAVQTGKFRMAWINHADLDKKELTLLEEFGFPQEYAYILDKTSYAPGSVYDNAITSGHYGLCNNILERDSPDMWQEFAIKNGIRSCLVLPVRKNGAIYGTFNLCSEEINFFTEEEIALMLEAAGDISFALDFFAKEQLRIEADKRMHESISRYYQAQKIAHLGSWHLNFASGEAIWSEEALNIYGLSTSATLQSYESWLSFIHPDDLQYVKSLSENARKSLQSSSFYHRIIRPDGSVRYLHSQAHFEFANGNEVGLYGMVHDITEVIEVKEALRQSQENLSILVDLIPQPIFAQDIDGDFISVNQSFADICGVNPIDMVGRNLHDFVPQNNNAVLFTTSNREIIERNCITVIPDVPFTDHAGNMRIFQVTKVPYTLPGKSAKAVLSIALDITENRQAELERNKLITDLVQRNKDLEQFSYIVSHNLRAPVANIIGLTSLMKELANDPGEQEIIIEGLVSSGRKLDGVIKDLNETLQIRHQVNEHKELVHFAPLLIDIEHSISNLLQHEDALIISDFSELEAMPSIKSYMYSIFFNLISNSIKYRKPGIRPIIEIKTMLLAGKIRIVFKDNGLGIDMSKKGEEVFGLYKRFHHHVGGKGMGLFMVKAQVERLGGRISVESGVNKGATFTIDFE